MSLPEKVYYSISEVSDYIGLESYVLRFWEKEFSSLSPKKNRGGNRVYKRSDVDLIEKIKYLLYEEQYTIEGAKKKLEFFKNISLKDYILMQKMVADPAFIKELKTILRIF